jgi:hypothetical protein
MLLTMLRYMANNLHMYPNIARGEPKELFDKYQRGNLTVHFYISVCD